jgi:hypothetical protein
MLNKFTIVLLFFVKSFYYIRWVFHISVQIIFLIFAHQNKKRIIFING